MIFDDRKQAGQLLAGRLKEDQIEGDLVLGLLRGGIVTALEVAKKLSLPLDFLTVRKIGAPFNPEYGIGAITADGTCVVNEGAMITLGISKESLEKEADHQKQIAMNREALFRKVTKKTDVANKRVILVDDGIAAGYTMRAAILAMRKQKAKSIIVAVPVATEEGALEIGSLTDRFVSLMVPSDFYAVGQFYRDFQQVEDSAVLQIIKECDNGTSSS